MGPLIEVGYVARAHGVGGEIKVATHDPASTVLLDADEVVIGERRFAVSRARRANQFVLLALENVVGRDAAEALRGQPVSVARELIPLDEGEVLLADLVGCAAVTVAGAPYGEVVAVEPGAQDLLVIHDGEVERLLPLVPALVPEVDVVARRVVVDPPEGLPEEPIGRGRRR